MKKLSILAFLAISSLTTQAQDAGKYKQFLGEYEVFNAPFSTINIEMRNGVFWGEAVGQGESNFVDTDQENTFDLESVPGATMEFISDSNKIVTSLILNMDQGRMEGQRKFPSKDDYNGSFAIENGPVSLITVGNEDGYVFVETAEYGKTVLKNTSILDQFFEVSYQSDFIFHRNEDGEVISLEIDVVSQGMNMVAMKELEKEEEIVEEGTDLSIYVGAFGFSDAQITLKTEVRDGRLFGSSEQGEGFLDPTDEEHIFEVPDFEVTFQFIFSEDGEITEVVLNYQGQPMSGFPKE